MSWNPSMWYQKYFDLWRSFHDVLQSCKSKIERKSCSESILLSLLWKDPDFAWLWNSCHIRYTLPFHLSFFSQSTKLSETLGPARRVFAANNPRFSRWYDTCGLNRNSRNMSMLYLDIAFSPNLWSVHFVSSMTCKGWWPRNYTSTSFLNPLGTILLKSICCHLQSVRVWRLQREKKGYANNFVSPCKVN